MGGVWIVMQAMALWWWVRLLEKVIQAVISEHVFGEVNSLEEQSKCFERGKACSQLFKFFSSIISRCVGIAVVKARSCYKANGETTRRRQGSKPSGARPKIVLDILETFIFYISTWTVRVVWKYGHAYIYFHTCRCCGASASSVATTTTSRETFDEWCHPDARFSVAKFWSKVYYAYAVLFKMYTCATSLKKVKVAHARLPSVGFRSWSRFMAASLQMTWVINLTVGCHYFPPGLQFPPQPLRGLLPISLLGEQRHNGCEQFV